MSAALYRTRVYHDGVKPGIVISAGVRRRVDNCPQIPGLPNLVGIDYAQETATYVITPQFGPRREMKAHEIAACKAWLELVAQGKA